MRPIRLPAVLAFSFLDLLGAGVALAASRLACHSFTAAAVVVGAVSFLLSLLLLYRILLFCFPLGEGELPEGSRAETAYHVYALFHLMYFGPISRSGLIPTPLTALYYRALGARIGKRTYSAGLICDPPLVEIGDDSLLGEGSLLVSHTIEGKRLGLHKIRIGSHVTVGFKSSVMPGVTIGDGALVAAHSLVVKNTVIFPGEVWAGIPAKKVSQSNPADHAC